MTTEEAAKPHTPADVHRRSWHFVLRRSLHGFGADQCPDIAASLTFYGVLALVPSLLVTFSVISLLGRGDETASVVVEVVRALVPDAETGAVRDVISRIAEARLSGILLAFALLLTLWSVARYVAALGRGMNRIYNVLEGRPTVRLKASQLVIALAVIVAVAAIVALLALTDGVAEAIGRAVGVGEAALVAWRIIRWPLLAAIVVLILAVLYYFAPNVKPARFRWISVGAGVALVVLLIASFGFWLYVSNFANYDRIYGAFAGVIVFALWLWIANMAILVCAEFDAELERVRQLQAGIPAESQVQVPLRDARRIAKNVRRDRKEEREARRIRR